MRKFPLFKKGLVGFVLNNMLSVFEFSIAKPEIYGFHLQTIPPTIAANKL